VPKGYQKQTTEAKKKGKINILIDDWLLVGLVLLFSFAWLGGVRGRHRVWALAYTYDLSVSTNPSIWSARCSASWLICALHA
jgi:hypothetical protein